MLFIFGNAEARRSGHFPWADTIQTLVVFMAVAGIALVAVVLTTDRLSGKTPVTQPGQKVEEQAPPAGNNLQNEPGITVPTAPVVVDYQVAWRNVGGSRWDPNDPYTALPKEEGFYDGSMASEVSVGFTADGSISTPPSEDALFAWRVLPQTKNLHLVRVAAVRDGEVTFAWIRGDKTNVSFDVLEDARREESMQRCQAKANSLGTTEECIYPFDTQHEEFVRRYQAKYPEHTMGEFMHLLLSVDGERSWCELNHRLPTTGWDPSALRMQVEGEAIRLYAQDSTVAGHWWQAVVNKSELPCS